MAKKQQCERLVTKLEKEIRPLFQSDEERAMYVDEELRRQRAPRMMGQLSQEARAVLDQISAHPSTRCSAVREAMHIMADRAVRRRESAVLEGAA